MANEIDLTKLGDWVSASDLILDFGEEVARLGDIGHVVEKNPDSWPTIYWERTGRLFDSIPGEQFHVLCAADFASSPETTPARPRREWLKRGTS